MLRNLPKVTELLRDIETQNRLASAREGLLSLAASKCDPQTSSTNITWEFAR